MVCSSLQFTQTLHLASNPKLQTHISLHHCNKHALLQVLGILYSEELALQPEPESALTAPHQSPPNKRPKLSHGGSHPAPPLPAPSLVDPLPTRDNDDGSQPHSLQRGHVTKVIRLHGVNPLRNIGGLDPPNSGNSWSKPYVKSLQYLEGQHVRSKRNAIVCMNSLSTVS